MQVPANRIGHVSNGGPFAAPQLKVITELLSLSAFWQPMRRAVVTTLSASLRHRLPPVAVA